MTAPEIVRSSTTRASVHASLLLAFTIIWLSLLAIVGSIAASLLVYTWVETPARRRLRAGYAQRDGSQCITTPAGPEISQSAP
ncbi:MAG TPA: hypothetical protein VFU22_02325 [Roseiflexaceae bacterium]|nr:hypothetical protein [Roseiflexaceae bacterium]